MVIVTTSWDDGCKSDLRMSKLLKKYNLTGTFYIPKHSPWTDLTEKEIKQLANDHEVGAHTINHIQLAEYPDYVKTKEITESKKWLEKVTGKTISSFCYPRNSYDQKTMDEVKKAGFTYARTCWRLHTRLTKNPMENGTTLQCLYHKKDLATLLFKYPHILPQATNWQSLARALFTTCKDDQIFHLWGHTWELDDYDMWEDLEEFFKWLKKQEMNITSKTNGELL